VPSVADAKISPIGHAASRAPACPTGILEPCARHAPVTRRGPMPTSRLRVYRVRSKALNMSEAIAPWRHRQIAYGHSYLKCAASAFIPARHPTFPAAVSSDRGRLQRARQLALSFARGSAETEASYRGALAARCKGACTCRATTSATYLDGLKARPVAPMRGLKSIVVSRRPERPPNRRHGIRGWLCAPLVFARKRKKKKKRDGGREFGDPGGEDR